MATKPTPYGKLSGFTFRELASNSKMDGGLMTEYNMLALPVGNLVPQYEAEDMGRRSVKPICFYKDGSLKSLPLQSQTILDTPAGPMPAELVTFYPSGAIKRIFPLDGKLSGFWSWQNEYKLAVDIVLKTPSGVIAAKIISAQFYESGALKSITLWPGQSITINTPLGSFPARKGVAFYETGSIRSFEPLKKIELPTPIGTIKAYDNEPNGIHGDINSVQFGEDGSITALSTVDNAIAVYSAGDSHPILLRPGVKNNVCGDERKVSVPMRIGFEGTLVTVEGKTPRSFDSAQTRMEVQALSTAASDPAYSCS
ncbi:MAG: hypothetical protein HQ516_08015 [Chlorobium sp.]|nr:hypothetical protein [Chlorobium phaeovibrioides]NQU46975.1 hypothetical protein [Chlorobium sp.]